MRIVDSLLLQDDERQRRDGLNRGLYIDLKKQIFLGIIGNICFFMESVDIDMARWYNQGIYIMDIFYLTYKVGSA